MRQIGEIMKIDKTELKRLSSLPDDLLWQEIVKLAGGYGFTLPKSTPKPSEMNRLRDALSGEKINALDAMRLLNTYKKGAGR